jgi:ubiquinone/menaquinone biosynthesis C-methylase UbiE
VKNNPYANVRSDVEKVVSSLILPNDTYHRTHEARIARTLSVLLDQKPSGRLLELGTGAVIPLALQELAPDLEVHVTDFNLNEPKVGDKYLTCGDKSMMVPAYRIDLESTPIPVEDNTFDVVLCCEVIEHMEIDPMFMMSEINRVLKTGGMLITTTPNAVSTWAVTKMLRGVEPYFYMQYRPTRNYYRHNYEYSIHSLAAVLKAAGFDGSAWTEDSFEEPNYTDVHKLRAIGYPMNHVGDNIFAVSRKIGPVVDRHPGVIYSN